MYTAFEGPPELARLNGESKELLAKLLAGITPDRSGIKLPGNTVLFQAEAQKGKLFLLREGVVAFRWKEKQLFLYDEGDLLGVSGGEEGSLYTEFAVVADEYDRARLLSKFLASKDLLEIWQQFLTKQHALVTAVAASLLKDDLQFEPAFLQFQEGDVMIEQGTEGKDVYTLVEGRANAFVDGVKVGEVLPDEIFGAIACLTDTPRIAKVVAAMPCLVLALPREKFAELIKFRPATVQSLIEAMARMIVDLNTKVAKIGSPQAGV